jgi:hypothetical protein
LRTPPAFDHEPTQWNDIDTPAEQEMVVPGSFVAFTESALTLSLPHAQVGNSLPVEFVSQRLEPPFRVSFDEYRIRERPRQEVQGSPVALCEVSQFAAGEEE